MAVDQCFSRDWRKLASAAKEDSEEAPAHFDCNICLDSARDPVVTLCGHLYCWPCIYEWFHVQSCSDEHLKCPVCKAELTDTSVVPLYGSGKTLNETKSVGSQSESDSEPEPFPEGNISALQVPPRPPACVQPLGTPNNTPPVQSVVARRVNTAEIEMLGESVYARVSGTPESVFVNPNSYRFVGYGGSGNRRRDVLADQSLNRISTFLFFCFLLCLLLF